MAVNPASKRSQNQLHIHVAPLNNKVKEMVDEVASHNDKSWVDYECDPKIPSKCTYQKGGNVQAKLVSSPSFSDVYTGFNDADGLTMVVASAGSGKGWVVMKSMYKAAECFLHCATDCESKCQ